MLHAASNIHSALVSLSPHPYGWVGMLNDGDLVIATCLNHYAVGGRAQNSDTLLYLHRICVLAGQSIEKGPFG